LPSEPKVRHKLTKLKADRPVIIGDFPLQLGNFAKYCSCAKINRPQQMHIVPAANGIDTITKQTIVSLDTWWFAVQQQINL